MLIEKDLASRFALLPKVACILALVALLLPEKLFAAALAPFWLSKASHFMLFLQAACALVCSGFALARCAQNKSSSFGLLGLLWLLAGLSLGLEAEFRAAGLFSKDAFLPGQREAFGVMAGFLLCAAFLQGGLFAPKDDSGSEEKGAGKMDGMALALCAVLGGLWLAGVFWIEISPVSLSGVLEKTVFGASPMELLRAACAMCLLLCASLIWIAPERKEEQTTQTTGATTEFDDFFKASKAMAPTRGVLSQCALASGLSLFVLVFAKDQGSLGHFFAQSALALALGACAMNFAQALWLEPFQKAKRKARDMSFWGSIGRAGSMAALVNRKGRMKEASDLALREFGLDARQAEGFPVMEALDSACKARHSEEIKQAMDKGRAWEGRLKFKARSGFQEYDAKIWPDAKSREKTGAQTYALIMDPVKALEESRERESKAAWTDPVTLLASRRALEDDLRKEIQEMIPGGLCLLMADIGEFRKFNEALGQELGDEALREFARRATSLLGEGERAYRLWADSFALLLRAESQKEAEARAEKTWRALTGAERVGPSAEEMQGGSVSPARVVLPRMGPMEREAAERLAHGAARQAKKRIAPWEALKMEGPGADWAALRFESALAGVFLGRYPGEDAAEKTREALKQANERHEAAKIRIQQEALGAPLGFLKEEEPFVRSFEERLAREKEEGAAKARVKQALDQGEMDLFFQPKIDLQTQKTVGAEALIRWLAPEKGLQGPMAILPYCKDMPMRGELLRFVMRRACEARKELHEAGFDIPISVNMEPSDLESGLALRLADEAMKEILPESMRPNSLTLEILESSGVASLDAARERIEEGKLLGLMFAVDDFGAGHASLLWLRRLPVEEIKIDQGFVRDMMEDDEDRAVVASSIALARTFGRKTTAEGADSLDCLRALKEMGATCAQGYAIAKPMPLNVLKSWLRDTKNKKWV